MLVLRDRWSREELCGQGSADSQGPRAEGRWGRADASVQAARGLSASPLVRFSAPVVLRIPQLLGLSLCGSRLCLVPAKLKKPA